MSRSEQARQAGPDVMLDELMGASFLTEDLEARLDVLWDRVHGPKGTGWTEHNVLTLHTIFDEAHPPPAPAY